jgi:arabinofuranosyltransferase
MLGGRSAPPLGTALLAVALIVCVVWAVAWWPNTIDDAYITYRYAANLAHGHGAVYNPGERVEGYSSPLWLGVLALATRLGADPEPVSKGLGLTFGFAALLVLGLALIRSGARPGLAGAAALVIAAFPTAHLFLVSGMETPAFCAALIIAACAGAVHEGPHRLPVIVPATLAVAFLRPEGVAMAGILTVAWMRRLRGRERWLLLAWVAVPVIGFLVARFAYYGSWLPNTFNVKLPPLVHLMESHDPIAFTTLVRAWRHNLWSGFDEAGGMVVIGLALPALASRDWPGVAALVAISGFAMVALMPADWMPGHRFALPFMALAIVAATWTVDHAVERWAARGRGAGWALSGVITLWLLRSTITGVEEWRDWVAVPGHPPLAAQRTYLPIGRWLKANAAAGQTMLGYEIGAFGHASGLRVFDLEGLVTPRVARVIRAAGESGAVRTGRNAAAMEQVVAAAVAASPDWFLVRTRAGAAPATGAAYPAAQAVDSLQRTLVDRFGDRMTVASYFPLAGAHDGGYAVLRRTSP